jgi:hypothetical protein
MAGMPRYQQPPSVCLAVSLVTLPLGLLCGPLSVLDGLDGQFSHLLLKSLL